jgi:hypothetical protein
MSGVPLSGGRPGREKTGGRRAGSTNILTRQALLDRAKVGGDLPHIALLKIGLNKRNSLAIRVQALGYAAPYFQHRMATPAARIIRPVDLDELKDAESAASAAAKVIAKTNSGEIDMEAGKFLLDAIDKFSHLYERQQLEERVMQLEAQLRANAGRSTIEGTTLTVIEGGLSDEPSAETS